MPAPATNRDFGSKEMEVDVLPHWQPIMGIASYSPSEIRVCNVFQVFTVHEARHPTSAENQRGFP